MDTGVGVLGIVIEDRQKVAARVNDLLSQYGHLIVGRMGIPYRDQGISVMALIIDGTTDDIGALSGKLGSLEGVKVKSALITRKRQRQ